jgi:hypothetical protein
MYGRGLASTIWPQESENLVFMYVKIESVDSSQIVVSFD